MVPGKRYAVFSIRTTKKHETIWIRAGVAYVQPDDSMNLYLDVLPLDGQLHVREATEKKEQAGAATSSPSTNDVPSSAPAPESWEAQKAMGGH